ncbi:Uncharacterised protein [Kingella negevensis]|uniref:Uncharacterized protein n=1 Tax=Kingella negevensis TaxID=1522312 RepID=A0A238HI57_9NEIS|nr:Uncharacterised protein [Kingella negevensis]
MQIQQEYSFVYRDEHDNKLAEIIYQPISETLITATHVSQHCADKASPKNSYNTLQTTPEKTTYAFTPFAATFKPNSSAAPNFKTSKNQTNPQKFQAAFSIKCSLKNLFFPSQSQVIQFFFIFPRNFRRQFGRLFRGQFCR